MDPTTHAFNREEVMAYLDGELTAERAAATAAHLEQCAECRELAASLRSLSRQMTEWEVGTIPATVEQNLLRAAATQKDAEAAAPREKVPVPSRRAVRWLVWGSALSAAALLLLAISIPNLMRSRSNVGMQQTAWPSAPGSAPSTPPAVARSQSLDEIARTRDLQAQSANAMRSKKDQGAAESREQPGPMIVRRASLAVLTKEFDAARAALENLVKAHQGYFGELNVASPAGAGRSLTATVRVPAGQLDGVLVELRKLGRVEQENQSADDVTREYVDLTARLANARETEKRLVEILRERTGKVSDVLQVEQQIARTRQQIEQMDAERKTLDNQVQYASVDLRITEEYKKSLETPAPSLGTRINNAAVEGFREAAELVLGLMLWLLGTVPSLLVLSSLLAWPGWWLVRWVRRRFFALAIPASR